MEKEQHILFRFPKSFDVRSLNGVKIKLPSENELKCGEVLKTVGGIEIKGADSEEIRQYLSLNKNGDEFDFQKFSHNIVAVESLEDDDMPNVCTISTAKKVEQMKAFQPPFQPIGSAKKINSAEITSEEDVAAPKAVQVVEKPAAVEVVRRKKRSSKVSKKRTAESGKKLKRKKRRVD